jgi:hypothetical protein
MILTGRATINLQNPERVTSFVEKKGSLKVSIST